VQNHVDESHPYNCVPRFASSLETKWSIINHDIAKFIGNYNIVLAFCELGIGIKYTHFKNLDLYKTKHPKHQDFTFIHVWCVLKKYLNGHTCKNR
jgi:hypothetical protein